MRYMVVKEIDGEKFDVFRCFSLEEAEIRWNYISDLYRDIKNVKFIIEELKIKQ